MVIGQNTVLHTFQGDWAACDDCSRRVEERDWEGLVNKVPFPDKVRDALKVAHEEFMAHRTTAERVPFG
jgi:hypothetical protein